MTRMQRLVLDAIEQLGPDVTGLQVYQYVRQRRIVLSLAACYPALLSLEGAGMVMSRWDEDPIATARRGGFRNRLYSVKI